MTDNATPIRSKSAGFRVGGSRRGRGTVLLYPDKLATVSWQVEAWGSFFGPFVAVAIAYPFIHDIGAFGAAMGVWAGRWVGEGIDKKMAPWRVAEGGDGVRVIPFDSVTSVQTRMGGRFAGKTLVVTTTDGTEYGFRGDLDSWQADLASALTISGRDVQATPEGITVTPREAGEVADRRSDEE